MISYIAVEWRNYECFQNFSAHELFNVLCLLRRTSNPTMPHGKKLDEANKTQTEFFLNPHFRFLEKKVSKWGIAKRILWDEQVATSYICDPIAYRNLSGRVQRPIMTEIQIRVLISQDFLGERSISELRISYNVPISKCTVHHVLHFSK